MIRDGEIICWHDVLKELPDADSEVLVCYQRNDCDERDTTLAVYDDSNEDSPWIVNGSLVTFGKVLFWSEKPSGPELKKVEA